MNPERAITAVTWNTDKGGNKEYRTRSMPDLTDYGGEVIDAIDVLWEKGVNIIALPDTHGWEKQHPAPLLKLETRYPFALTVPLQDERFLSTGKDTSITVLTNLPVKSHDVVRLFNRNCIRLTVEKNGSDIDVYAVYLDDMKEQLRIQQTGALVKEIQKRSNPTIIMGDLNCTSANDGRLISQTLLTLLERIPRKILSYKNSSRKLIELSRNLLTGKHTLMEKYRNHGPIRYLQSEGFTDSSDINNNSTFPTKKLYHRWLKMLAIPFINVDRILASKGIVISRSGVLKNKEFTISDHFPRIATLIVQ